MTTVEAQPILYKMTWTAGTVAPRNNMPMVGDIKETTKFKTEADCLAFGDLMAPRLRDWVRGRFNVDWDHPVGVKFKCEINGDGT